MAKVVKIIRNGTEYSMWGWDEPNVIAVTQAEYNAVTGENKYWNKGTFKFPTTKVDFEYNCGFKPTFIFLEIEGFQVWSLDSGVTWYARVLSSNTVSNVSSYYDPSDNGFIINGIYIDELKGTEGKVFAIK